MTLFIKERAVFGRPSRSKYGNRKTRFDGVEFDSAAEARRCAELRLLEQAGLIRNLELQPKFSIEINGRKICAYIADFAYFEGNRRVVEDVKSPATAKNPVFRLKKRMVEALYPGITITVRPA